ncbi:ATP synthase F0 subunit B [bacterium]|nr:ATP synthase F0 subunit B [bacterium]
MLQLPPDETFYVEILLFLAFAAIMSKLVWTPLLHVLHERSKRTIGAQKEAVAMKEEAAEMQKRMEATIEQARIAGNDAGEAVRRDAEAEERRILDAAHAEASRALDDVRKRVAAETEQARAELRTSAQALAATAAERILERPVQS